MFQKCTSKSRKGVIQSAFKVFPFDMFQYEILFSNTEAFGDWTTYKFNSSRGAAPQARGRFNFDFECPVSTVPLQRRQVVCQANEVVNLHALVTRSQEDLTIFG